MKTPVNKVSRFVLLFGIRGGSLLLLSSIEVETADIDPVKLGANFGNAHDIFFEVTVPILI